MLRLRNGRKLACELSLPSCTTSSLAPLSLILPSFLLEYLSYVPASGIRRVADPQAVSALGERAGRRTGACHISTAPGGVESMSGTAELQQYVVPPQKEASGKP